MCEIIIKKYNKYKKQYEKDQQTIKSIDKLYTKSLQYTLIDKNEHDSLCTICTKIVDETKNGSFL